MRVCIYYTYAQFKNIIAHIRQLNEFFTKIKSRIIAACCFYYKNISCQIASKKSKVTPLQAYWPLGFWKVKAPEFLDTRHMKVVRSSPLPPGISWYPFLEAESTPGHMELSDATEKIPNDRGSISGPSD
jgi:hypothetical protein